MSPPWRPAYVAIGSNLDSPREQVASALTRLAALGEVRSLVNSRLYRTRPLGPQDQPDFINAAAGFVTTLGARALLEALLGIERDMGRQRGVKWGPRSIDLDLVWLLGGDVDEPGLTVPHPGVSSRNFVLYPLNDIAPTLRIPGVGAIGDLAMKVGDEGISVLE